MLWLDLTATTSIFFLKEFVAALKSLKPLVKTNILSKNVHKWANIFDNHFNPLQDVWLPLVWHALDLHRLIKRDEPGHTWFWCLIQKLISKCWWALDYPTQRTDCSLSLWASLFPHTSAKTGVWHFPWEKWSSFKSNSIFHIILL